jgi:hypothetical protein
MTGKKREHETDERLDLLGRAVIRASADNEETGEAAAASSFLYTRLRTRINAERLRREERDGLRALFGAFWRAVPAMAIVALLAFVLFVSTTFTRTLGGYSDEALLGEREGAGVERVVFANDRQALSSDDVLATILNDEERGSSR